MSLVLGFEGEASGDRDSAQRGQAFVDLLRAGRTFVDAWALAVLITNTTRTDVPVALALGGSEAQARLILNTWTLGSTVDLRAGAPRGVAVSP